MITDILRKLEEEAAKRHAHQLPTPEEFAHLATMLRTASLTGGLHLSPDQCQAFGRTFSILSIAIIAVDQR